MVSAVECDECPASRLSRFNPGLQASVALLRAGRSRGFESDGIRTLIRQAILSLALCLPTEVTGLPTRKQISLGGGGNIGIVASLHAFSVNETV
jgi:hypothetical protein